MAKSKKQLEWKALESVRWAVKGWAFTSDDRLPGYITHAEKALTSVPEAHKLAGEALIQPLRDALKGAM